MTTQTQAPAPRAFIEPEPTLDTDAAYRISDAMKISYPVAGGGTEHNFGELTVPFDTPGPVPVLIMIHGGGWTEPVSIRYMQPLAREIAAHGIAVWNIEYRRVKGGGGWPITLTDVASAVDFVPELVAPEGVRLATDRIHVTGHSAGGHLAAWVASRPSLPASAPGSNPLVKVSSGVILSGVFDLVEAHRNNDPWVVGFLGGTPDQVDARYLETSPIDHLPIGIPITCVHGAKDPTVPVRQSEAYVEKAGRLGDQAMLVELADANHIEFAVPGSPAWLTARDQILRSVRTSI